MGCEMTKDQDMEKFLIIGCDGEIEGTAGTLQEAERKAEGSGACGVLKMLRLCQKEAYTTILSSLGMSSHFKKEDKDDKETVEEE